MKKKPSLKNWSNAHTAFLIPLIEYKRREADRIGNQVFIILFYLMIFGNLIPLLLAYKYPQEVALIYPPLILVIALISAGYVTYQMKKQGYSYWSRYAEWERK